MSKGRDYGLETVKNYFAKCHVDEEWSVWEERAFSWWGYNLRQRVWSEKGRMDNGVRVYRVCAETDLVADVEWDDQLPSKINEIIGHSCLSLPYYNSEKKTITLFTSLYVHKEVIDQNARLFLSPAILQVIEAELIVADASRIIGGRPDYTAHPKNGFRTKRDEMLTAVDACYIPHGQQDPVWGESEEYKQLSEYSNKSGGFSMSDKDGVTIEFPFGPNDTSLIQIKGKIPHPWLGNGLSLSLKLPVVDDPEYIDRACILLNQKEHEGSIGGNSLGLWRRFTQKGGGCLPEFFSFIPQTGDRRLAIINHGFAIGAKARIVTKIFTNKPDGDIRKIMMERFGKLDPERVKEVLTKHEQTEA